MRIKVAVGLVIWMGLGLAITGCGKDAPEIKYKPFEGRVKEINLGTSEVTVEIFFEEDGKYHPFVGKMAPDCEILIDGKTAEPEDVKVDDFVKLMVMIEKRDGETYRVAKKVEVVNQNPVSTTQAEN